MKSTVFALSVLSTVPCFGLVREVASCETANGQYSINVAENQGSGPIRPNPAPTIAVVKTTNGATVGRFNVELFKGLQPISFGRPQYRDVASSGDAFKLEGPSTNYKNYIVTATITVNGSTQVLSDEDVKCSLFVGARL